MILPKPILAKILGIVMNISDGPAFKVLGLPPEKANNSNSTHLILGDTLMNHIGSIRNPWDLSGLRYKNMQRGMGGYTLCENCNNNTGAWYANDYINFVNTIGYVLTNKINTERDKAVKIELKEMYANMRKCVDEFKKSN